MLHASLGMHLQKIDYKGLLLHLLDHKKYSDWLCVFLLLHHKMTGGSGVERIIIQQFFIAILNR